jgi:hypothetical protein
MSGDLNLHVCFPHSHDWYLYPHDELMRDVLEDSTMGKSLSWERGGYSFPRLSKKMKQRLEPYKLVGTGTQGVPGEDAGSPEPQS